MTEKKSPIISFKNFSFQYRAQKKPTLKEINLDIYPGERVLIAGPSGCGKSTLAGCINGLNPFSNPGECSGELIVDGVDAPKSSIFQLSAHVGTVLQDPDGQFIGLTVGEDIAFALENSCMPQDEMHEITRHAAELVGIQDHLDYAPHELSGGQKQRVSLAGVMVDQVKILLFDEPLANLDPATGKQTIELIDEIQEKTDTTVVIIEHRLEDVLWRDVDRIVLMGDGKILADLHPDELLSTRLLEENGIREPLYLTALRYAGVELAPAKKPAHVDSVVIDEADRKKMTDWFWSRPAAEAEKEHEPLLEVRNLTFGYERGRQTLRDVSLTIQKGEMVSIVGKNGAGKSTILKMITGVSYPTEGEIVVDGRVSALLELTTGFDSEFTGRENIYLKGNLMGMSDEEISVLEEQIVNFAEIGEYIDQPVRTYSSGMKARLGFSVNVNVKPEILIIDEALSVGDKTFRQKCVKKVREVMASDDVTLLFVTHSTGFAREFCSRGIVLEKGKIRYDGKIGDAIKFYEG